ncbi:MAG: DUF1501 domain-containing protein, partial [Planctomycetota bacterium]
MFALPLPSRRSFLKDAGLGFGALALSDMLHRESLSDQPAAGQLAAGQPVIAGQPGAALDPLAPKPEHFPAKVKSVIWLFMTGAPSQVDTWDYKPELQKRDGQSLAGADPKTGFF